jgi:2-polyprenyl-3-methyl-5-hydroxy-6-metoxy-1,4-benzoquinol methylase
MQSICFPARVVRVALENSPCPLDCSGAADEFVITGRDRLYKVPGEFTVVRCSACGLMRTDPRPTLETIGCFYPPEYSPHQRREGKEFTLRDRAAGLAHRLMNAWRVPDLPAGNLLEIGCGSGGYLLWMAHHSWNVAGIEMSQPAGEKARSLGFPVHIGPLQTTAAPEALHDLTIGWMVLEHLHDPIKSLRKLAGWTRPGGWLAISVPNAASREASFFGDSWFALELPRHLYHFTPKTIVAVLAAGGWKSRKIYHQRSVDNVIASCGYSLETSRPGVRRWLSRKLIEYPTNVPLHFLTYPFLFPVASALAIFGETGRMTILAQKAD